MYNTDIIISLYVLWQTYETSNWMPMIMVIKWPLGLPEEKSISKHLLNISQSIYHGTKIWAYADCNTLSHILDFNFGVRSKCSNTSMLHLFSLG